MWLPREKQWGPDYLRLDGGNMLQPWLPQRWRRGYDLVAPFGFILLFGTRSIVSNDGEAPIEAAEPEGLDADALEQILNNLLSNVEKYAPDSELVEVESLQNGSADVLVIYRWSRRTQCNWFIFFRT